MKKYIAVVVSAGALAAALVIPAGASAYNDTAYNAIGQDNPALTPGPCTSALENEHNEELRFGPGGRIAIPGEAGSHANDASAVEPYSKCGSGGIVNPPAGE